MKNSKSVIVAVLILHSNTVTAATQLPTTPFSLGDLQRIQEQTLLSQAKLEEARAENELQTLSSHQSQPTTPLSQQASSTGSNSLDMPQRLTQSSVDQHQIAASLPEVEQIWGNSHHLHARLKRADGATVIAEANTVLASDGLKVVAITPHQVLVTREQGSAFALAFSGGAND